MSQPPTPTGSRVFYCSLSSSLHLSCAFNAELFNVSPPQIPCYEICPILGFESGLLGPRSIPFRVSARNSKAGHWLPVDIYPTERRQTLRGPVRGGGVGLGTEMSSPCQEGVWVAKAEMFAVEQLGKLDEHIVYWWHGEEIAKLFTIKRERQTQCHRNTPRRPLISTTTNTTPGWNHSSEEEELGQRKRKVAIATESATTNTIHLLYFVVAGLNPVKKVPTSQQYQERVE